ncbi:MAG: TauD/TfdA family dioxygenase [bacterium]|nr:TauD/TfdA family dioxygenase [bacterium]
MAEELYRPYAAQARHYFFERPHEGICERRLEVPAAWRGDELKEDDWRTRLTTAQAGELERALEGALSTGTPQAQLSAADFPIPGLEAQIASWREELATGRGFLAVSGMPIAGLTDEEAGLVFWGFGLHLGWPGAQNTQGDLLGHVVDTGEDAGDPFVRRYRTAGDIAFHCDAVGLLCLRTARRGGASRIASSVTVYNELLSRRPDLVPRLYEPFALDIRPGQQGWIPVAPCRHAAGELRIFYHTDYFRSAPRHPEVSAFTEYEQELLDLYEEIAHSPGIHLDMELAPGDMQFISNHTVLHARTAYEDAAGQGGRHLLRLWLSLGSSPAGART